MWDLRSIFIWFGIKAIICAQIHGAHCIKIQFSKSFSEGAAHLHASYARAVIIMRSNARFAGGVAAAYFCNVVVDNMLTFVSPAVVCSAGRRRPQSPQHQAANRHRSIYAGHAQNAYANNRIVTISK